MAHGVDHALPHLVVQCHLLRQNGFGLHHLGRDAPILIPSVLAVVQVIEDPGGVDDRYIPTALRYAAHE